MAENDTKSHWLWRALRKALPFGSPAKAVFQVITTVLALLAIYVLRGEPQMTEELWWLLAVSIAIGFAYTLNFVWALTGDAKIPLDKKRRSAVIAAFLAFGGAALAFGRFGNRPEERIAQPEELTGDLIINRRFRVTDIIETSRPAIEGKTLRNCDIFGPAVIFLYGVYNNFDGCSFEGPINALFWKVHPDQQKILGAIGIANCTFIECRFKGIGFVGADEQIDNMREKVEGSLIHR